MGVTKQLEELARDWAAAELRGDTAVLGEVLVDDYVGGVVVPEPLKTCGDSRLLPQTIDQKEEAHVR